MQGRALRAGVPLWAEAAPIPLAAPIEKSSADVCALRQNRARLWRLISDDENGRTTA